MEDILAYSKFMGAILEAHKQGDTKREKQLARRAEEHFDFYDGVPDYDAETGEAVEEIPFDEELKAAERTGTDGNKILQKCLSDAKALQAQANEYLTTTEGTKAPGRSYMRRCLYSLECNIEYLAQLSQKWQDSAVIKEDTFQEGGVANEKKEDEMDVLYPHGKIGDEKGDEKGDNREPLFERKGIKDNIKATDFAEYVQLLINNGVLCMGNDHNEMKKLQCGFKSFLIGASLNDIEYFGENDLLRYAKGTKFVSFIDALQNKMAKVAPDAVKNNIWSITVKWFVAKEYSEAPGGRDKGTLKKAAKSLTATLSREKKQQVGKITDKGILELVDTLIKILCDK